MLRLKGASNPGWAVAAAADLDTFLSDHVHCEKKAAATALSLINRYPSHDALVDRLIAHAAEELQHFRLVLDLVRGRGLRLGRDSADGYVNSLLELSRKGDPGRLTDALLCAALIEARSCERFTLLVDILPDSPERALLKALIPSEARHFAMFMNLAREYADPDEVESRFDRLAEEEARIVRALPNDARVHG